jgi:hypothetical protein
MSAIGPKRTWTSAPQMSAFGGKADMTFCENPLSRSLLGVKQTSRHRSTLDAPERLTASVAAKRFGWRYRPQKENGKSNGRVTLSRFTLARVDLGCAASTACEFMSGAGAGAEVRTCIGSGCGCSGRPTRLLVTIGDEPFSSVASATNNSASNAKPATAKKTRTGI